METIWKEAFWSNYLLYSTKLFARYEIILIQIRGNHVESLEIYLKRAVFSRVSSSSGRKKLVKVNSKKDNIDKNPIHSVAVYHLGNLRRAG